MDSLARLVEQHVQLSDRYVELCVRQKAGERVVPELEQTIAAIDVITAIALWLRRQRDEQQGSLPASDTSG